MVAPNESVKASLTKFFEGNPQLFGMIVALKGTRIREIADKTIISLVPKVQTDNPVTLSRLEIDALCAAACLGLEFCDCVQIV